MQLKAVQLIVFIEKTIDPIVLKTIWRKEGIFEVYISTSCFSQ